MKVAQVELAKKQRRYKTYADKSRRHKSLQVGDKVLVLLHTDRSKLLMHLQGPFEITEKLNSYDYRVKVRGKDRIYHANLLRKYIERDAGMLALMQTEMPGEALPEEQLDARVIDGDEGDYDDEELLEELCVAVVEEDDSEGNIEPKGNETLKLELLQLHATESAEDVQINPELSQNKQEELKALVREFKDVLTDVPGDTDNIEHDIKLTSDTPVRSRPYLVPIALRESFNEDIKSMLKLGIIEPCDSPYAS